MVTEKIKIECLLVVFASAVDLDGQATNVDIANLRIPVGVAGVAVVVARSLLAVAVGETLGAACLTAR